MELEEKKYLSKEKYEELARELEELKTVKRREIAEQLEYAKSLGDLSENAEYHEARDNQANLEKRIRELEAILKMAEIVSVKQRSKVNVGSKVTLRPKNSKEAVTYTIVGSEEADIAARKVSNESPIGRALMGKRPGETAEVHTPSGVNIYTIEKIS